jgi:hypothetical protein
MKRIIAVILLTPSVVLGANVTATQIKQAKAGASALISCGVEIMRFAAGVEALMNQNFEVAIVGSTETVALSNAQKNRVIDKSVYDAKVQACQNALNSLP